jgi:hypothetical protein
VVDLFLVVSDGGIEVVLTVIAFGTTTLQPPHHHPFLLNISREVQTLKIEFNASERHNTLVWQSHRIWGL